MAGSYKIQISNVGVEAESILDDPKRRSTFVKEAIAFYLAHRNKKMPAKQELSRDSQVIKSLTSTIQIQATTIQAQLEEITRLKSMYAEHAIQGLRNEEAYKENVIEKEEIVIEKAVEEVVEEVEPQKTTNSPLFSFEEVGEDEEVEELEADILNSINSMLGM